MAYLENERGRRELGALEAGAEAVGPATRQHMSSSLHFAVSISSPRT